MVAGATTTHQVVITVTADEVTARDGAAWSPGIMAGLPRHNARSQEEFAGWASR